MNRLPKFKMPANRRIAKSNPTSVNKRLYLGQWRLEEDDDGNLVIIHSLTDRTVVIAKP